MFENIINFFKNIGKKEKANESSDTAKERLHLVLMQDRANVSADFLELMKQEIIEVIKKYIDIDEKAIDVRLTNKANDDGTVGAPALYANIPIVTIRNEARKANVPHNNEKNVENISKIEEKETENKNVTKKDKVKDDEQNKTKSTNLNESKVEVTDKVVDEAKEQGKNASEQENRKQSEEQKTKQEQQIDTMQTQNIDVSTNIEDKEKIIVNESKETKEDKKGEEEGIKNKNGEQT